MCSWNGKKREVKRYQFLARCPEGVELLHMRKVTIVGNALLPTIKYSVFCLNLNNNQIMYHRSGSHAMILDHVSCIIDCLTKSVFTCFVTLSTLCPNVAILSLVHPHNASSLVKGIF